MTKSKPQRRSRGTGSIFQRRDDGRWVAERSVLQPDGSRKTVQIYRETHAEAEQALFEARAEEFNRARSANAQTLEDYLLSWLEASKRRVRGSTFRSYKSYVVNHIVPRLGAIPLWRLTPSDVETFQHDELDAGVSPATVNHARKVLSIALGKAVRYDLVPKNVAKLADPIKVPRYDYTPLTAQQARSLIDGSRDHQLGPLFVAALATGMRQGELLGLKWADIDLAGRSLSVRRTLQGTLRGQPLFEEPKTKRSIRTVPLNNLSLSAFEHQYDLQERQQAFFGDDWKGDNDLVFTTGHGTPLMASNVTRDFKRLLRRLGLPRVRFHDLRHTYATLLLSAGVQPRVLSDNLGHSTISITMDVYAHVLPVAQANAADAMDRLLGI